MDSSFYKTLVHEAPIGYAHHKIVLDKAGTPVDYTFLEVNKAFEELTGLAANDITGRKATEVLPGIKDDPFDWIGFFGQVALKGEPKTFQQYSAVLKRWYDVKTYSPKKGCFITAFVDITQARESMETLKKSEERYRGLLESQNDMIVRVDQQNRFTYVNDKYCETFGKTREELVGKSFVPLVHEEDQQHTLEEMEKLKKPPYRCQIEQRAYTVNGWRWLHWEDSAIVDKDGNILEVQGVGRDITELKEKEAALEKKNLEMQSLLTHTPAVIYAYRMVDGKPDITYINDNVREVLGYEPGQFLHNFSNWIDCLHPDDLTLLQEKRIYDQQYHQPGKSWYGEYRFRDARGNYRWLADKQKTALDLDGNLEFIGAWTDITGRREMEDALKQYQERLSQAQAFTNTGLWEYDIQTGQLYWSKECEALFGLEEGEFTGSFEAFLERVHPDDRDEVRKINQPIVEQKTGKPLEFEHRIIRKGGEVRWVRETAGVSKDAEGKPEKIIGFIVDITRQKKAEDAIEKEEKLRQIIDNFEGLFWLRAADTHKILYISPGYEEIFGKTAESLYEDPSSFLENILEEDKARVAKDYETFKRTGHFNTEYRMHSADGSIRWMSTRTFPVTNAQGETIRYAGIAADITERKLAEEAIQRSNQRLESLFEISKEVTSSTDQDTLIQMIVNNAIKLAGLGTGAIYLKDQDEKLRLSATAPALPDIFPDELRFASMKDHPHIEKALQTGEHVLMEDASSTRLTSEEKKAIDLRNLRTNLFLPIMIRERAIGVLILSSVGKIRTFTSDDLNLLRGFAFQAAHIIDNLNNYTDLKKYAQELEGQIAQREKAEQELIIAKEKAEESDRLKSAFLATMNHELRTPLNHVIGFSDVIQSMAEDEDIRDFGASIYQSGNNLLSIIEDIFALAMAEQDKVRVKQEYFSVMELLNDAKSSLKGILNAAGKRDQIEVSFNPELKILKSHVVGDRNKINQVLNNLFKNAVKFTKKGEIAFGFYREGEDRLTLYVKDTGVGVPEDKKEVIFEFFRQGDDSHTREHDGVGIGLAISRRILEAMDGRIWLESEEGKGSTFYFNIPLEVTDQEKTSQQSSVEVPDLSGNSLLLVEDDEDSMMLLRAMLNPTGAKILEATDGQEALVAFNKNPDTDMVLMDLRMPRMDGFEATRAIKAKQADLPVVALTAYTLEADRKKAEKAGSDQLLTKPVHKEMLYRLLEKHLGDR